MKLHHSQTSPYVRKVVVCAAELGLSDRIELVPSLPSSSDGGPHAHNPLGKVPALVTDAGEVLYDSPVICEYLDSLHDGAKLFPAASETRWRALRLQALADGVLDAAVGCVLEGRRPESERSATFVDHQKGKILRGLDVLEAEASGLGNALDIGTLAVGCALGYLDFRFADTDWRAGRPTLAAWYQGHAKRPSMAASAPRDPA